MIKNAKRYDRAFTLLELIVAFIILAVLSAIAVPSLASVVSNSSLNAASAQISAVAIAARYTSYQLDVSNVPTSAELAATIAVTPGFTGVNSSFAPAPSTSPNVISYADPPASSSLAVIAPGNAGCAFALITSSGVQVWTSSSTTGCNAFAALSGPPAASATTTIPPTTTTTAPTATTTTTAAPTTTTTAAPVTAPGAPTSPTGSWSSTTSALVSWVAPASNGGSAITHYTVTASPGGASCTTSSTSCTVSGLSSTTTYSFTITATNAVGTGPSSEAVTPLQTDGNITTCAQAGYSGALQLGSSSATSASDSYITGTVHGSLSQYVDIAVALHATVSAVIVKGGPDYNTYNIYTQVGQNLVSPLNSGGNVPTISHWFVCYTVQ
jgi:prepilin-type N-terminal cleavage/methylation domain-containing protein